MMNSIHKALLSVLIIASALVSAPAHAQNVGLNADAQFAEAMEYYQLGKWPQAFERLQVLADGRHAESARIAVLMHRFGPRLYGVRSDASKDQVQRWARIASQQYAALIRLSDD